MAPILKCGVCVLLAFFLSPPVPAGAEGYGPFLRRPKRDWVVAPRKLLENHDYTGLASIAKIRSDKEYDKKIFYSLSGPGVDEPPINIFSIDRESGDVKIHAILDRETIPTYYLKGVARFVDGTYAEKDINVTIKVDDVNDCPPVIKAMQVGFVNESSAAGTLVMKVIATDADQEGLAHSQIFYSLDEKSNRDRMFSINSRTGEIRVFKSSLDRETKDTYKLMVRASDMNGAPGGNLGSEEIEIKIGDINDNIPMLEKEMYEGSVEENTVNVEVMRIKATDMDLIYTENWQAVYKIVSGNEAGYFSVTTDSKTNEGIIMINKAVDYEELKVLNLGMVVSNKAQYSFDRTVESKSYPIKINVVNQKEGPRFQPSVKVVTLSEGGTSTSLTQVITTYSAIDSDTLQTATNVRYAKIKDDDNWLIIDEKTAEIRLKKMPDRESKFLVNGTYYAEIICISQEDFSKTATGTIAIQVQDFNDHCPKLTSTTQTLCLEHKVIYVTAVDEDEFPNSAPFKFTVVDGRSKGKWSVEYLNATTAILRDDAKLWPGIYQVAVRVKDQQGHSCDEVETVDVTVCSCKEDGKMCSIGEKLTVGLGAGGILFLLLGLLLLLLLPLLLMFCLCGGAAAAGDFKSIPFDTKQQLISYHTEGQGEDKEVPLLHVPVEVDGGQIRQENVNGFGAGFLSGMHNLGGAAAGGVAISEGINTSNFREGMFGQYGQWGTGREEAEMMFSGNAGAHGFSQYGDERFDGMALSEQYLGQYYASKCDHATLQSQQKDSLLVYDYEGRESLAGSVGCCSQIENENDLAFLDDLGPKFKTLAGICSGSMVESVGAGVSVSQVRPASPVRPSTQTHVHTHTETVRDRERVNVNTVDTSNVASGSSAHYQEETLTGMLQGSTGFANVSVQDQVMIPSQTVLMQQPTMYYAATPMYVVEPQSQMLLVSGGSQHQAVGQVGQVGLSQGLVQVGGLQAPQGVIYVEGQQGMHGVAGQYVQGHSQGTVSRPTKVVVVEGGSVGREQGQPFAQRIVQTGQGPTVQGYQVQSQGFTLGSLGSSGSHEEFSVAAPPMSQGSQRVVAQRKKVSVTERKMESNTRA